MTNLYLQNETKQGKKGAVMIMLSLLIFQQAYCLTLRKLGIVCNHLPLPRPTSSQAYNAAV